MPRRSKPKRLYIYRENVRMFRVKTTRRNVKRALSPLKHASDPSAPPSNILVESQSSPPLHAVAKSTSEASASSVVEKQEQQMTDLFAAEAAFVALTKPWLRLERGIRMQKLRTFADNFEGLVIEDKDNLYKYLVRANDSKLLNTKQQIQYEQGSIQSIKGLKIIRTGNPSVPATFKIEMHRATKRNSSD
jgi:hypothetical protein